MLPEADLGLLNPTVIEVRVDIALAVLVGALLIKMALEKSLSCPAEGKSLQEWLFLCCLRRPSDQ